MTALPAALHANCGVCLCRLLCRLLCRRQHSSAHTHACMHASMQIPAASSPPAALSLPASCSATRLSCVWQLRSWSSQWRQRAQALQDALASWRRRRQRWLPSGRELSRRWQLQRLKCSRQTRRSRSCGASWRPWRSGGRQAARRCCRRSATSTVVSSRAVRGAWRLLLLRRRPPAWAQGLHVHTHEHTAPAPPPVPCCPPCSCSGRVAVVAGVRALRDRAAPGCCGGEGAA